MSDLIKCLTRDELQLLVDYFKSPEARPRDVMFEMMLLAGLRSDELFHLKMRDFNLVTGMLELPLPSKGSNKGYYDLNPGGVAERLRALYRSKDLTLFEDEPMMLLFADRRQTKESAKRWIRANWAIVKKRIFGRSCQLGAHSLRHTYAVQLRELASIEQLQQGLRHKSILSTMEYVKKPTREQVLMLQQETAARLYDKSYQKD